MRKLAVLVVLVGCASPARPSQPSPPREPTPEQARAQAIDQARTAGILGDMAQPEGTFASLTATDNGIDTDPLDRAAIGDAGAIDMRGPAPRRVSTVVVGQGTTKGDLDKDIIRRYVRQNLSRIRACYEKELATKPTLAGTVTVSFQIKPDGTVGNAVGRGMPPVDACIAGVIETIRFPSPRGGGSVDVNYPFELRP